MEVLSGPERRRRWSMAEKLAIIHETYEADATVNGSLCNSFLTSAARPS
ncbi:transposase (plasmid) [Sinorhizobium americanum]|uniref:Transposase n=1 Tax=Sinorhizobium americanum TaxID=194963 RepID=A0A1L3LSW5_9HYPH|nr:transposase [Sinorhizobium americanum]